MKYNVCDNHGHTESPFIPLLLKPSAGRLRDGRGDGRVTPTAKLAQQGCAPLPDQTINRLSLSVFISVYPCQDFVLSFQLPAPRFCFSTQSSVARTVWRNRIVKLPSAGPKAARTVWRNRIVKLFSAGPKAARTVWRNRIVKLFSAGPKAARTVWRNRIVKLFSAGPKAARTVWRKRIVKLPSAGPEAISLISLLFPRCFYATQKTLQSQLLIDGNSRPRNPWCFHLFPWRMKNEYRTQLTLLFPHGNTQPSVSTMFRRSFHGPEKD